MRDCLYTVQNLDSGLHGPTRTDFSIIKVDSENEGVAFVN
jgi:hypothetical protein